MTKTVIELGRCGWGVEKGPPRVIRAGWVAVYRLPGSVLQALRQARDAMRAVVRTERL